LSKKTSWREAYDYFKTILPNLALPKHEKKELKMVFKELTRIFEKLEKQPNIITLNNIRYKGSLDPDLNISEGVAIGWCEILGGSFLMIIPFTPSQVAAGALIGDGVSRVISSLETQSPEPESNQNYDSYGQEDRLSDPSYCDRISEN